MTRMATGFAADLCASIAVRDQRALENAQVRDRMRKNAELRACLLADASRRGQSEIDWPEYFRNAGVNYP